MVNLFCFGFGYVAQRMSSYLRGWEIAGTSRTHPDHIPFTGHCPIDEQIFNQHTSFLISIPPDMHGDCVLRHHRDLFVKYRHTISWIGYLSATSVYGDHQGAYVDETSHPHPSSKRGEIRLWAEQQWLELYQQEGLPVHIFRLSGIYGPQRNVLQTITQGRGLLIDKPNHVFSRIHVDDICQVLQRSLLNPAPGSIYNVADDTPTSSAEVMAYGYQLLNLTAPTPIPFDQADLTPMAREFYQDHKRINNAKIKEELGIILYYPSYREGLEHCWQEDYGSKED